MYKRQGLVRPSAGEIELFGEARDAGGCAPHGPQPGFSRIGALIEDPGVLPTFSALENLMGKAIAIGVVRAEAHCRELLELVGLADTGSLRVKKFSLGMKQRLGLALALVGNPELLLLDEPFNGLDPEATRSMRNALMRINRERGVTMVISSHVLDQLDRMATRFGVIRAGRMVREISVDELHRECGSSIRVKTADPARSLAVLEEHLPTATLRAEPDGAILVSGNARHATCLLYTSITEASRGLGMTPAQTLLRVRLPLAAPAIIAGLRMAAISCVGIATVAATINAGGLGSILFSGLRTLNVPKILGGTLCCVLLALAIDALLRAVEKLTSARTGMH